MCAGSTYQILDSANGPGSITIKAHLSGMFFLAESPWDRKVMPNSEAPTLTCYRRNLFNIAGVIHIPRDVAAVIGSNGHIEKVEYLSVDISVTESLADTSVMLLSLPPKHVVESYSNTKSPPNPIKLDIEGNSNQYMDPCPFSMFWNRLQFKAATAKNNRRAALQQYYYITINVSATLEDGSKVVVSKATSLPIVVRGRSPGSYQTTRTTVPELESTTREKEEALETTYVTENNKNSVKTLTKLMPQSAKTCSEASQSDIASRAVFNFLMPHSTYEESLKMNDKTLSNTTSTY